MYKFIGLKKSTDFRNIYGLKDSKANNLLVMYKKKNEYNYNRYGISVSKKVGNSVIRHRLKRQLKEIIRLSENILSGYDIVIVVRNNSSGKPYDKLNSAFLNLIKRHNLIKR